MAKKVTVKYTTDDITTMLKERLLVNDALRFAQLIIGHLEQNSTGLEQVVKAMWDIYPTTKYCVGDFVYVDKTYLPTWRDMDLEKTLELPGNKGNLVMCEIVEISLYSDSPLHIKYDVIRKNGEKHHENYYTQDSLVDSRVENLADVLDDIEDLNNNV
jgi:hypothetical protein